MGIQKGRRRFLIGSVVVFGGFAIGYKFRENPGKDDRLKGLFPDETAITPYVVVSNQGITIITPRAEMGQGIHTTMAALVAEELDVPVSEVEVKHGPASNLYANYTMFPVRKPSNLRQQIKKYLNRSEKPESRQLTGGQTSIRDSFVKMRKAGAAARQVLLEAAAKKWAVDPESLYTSNGIVVGKDGQKLSYTDLAELAAGIQPPADPKLKPKDQWKYLGRSQPRVDMAVKCRGTAPYAIDLQLPDMLHAVVRLNPHLGANMISYDANSSDKMPGVKKVIPLKNGVVVCATNTWYALQAAKTIDITWEEAPYPASTGEHRAVISDAMHDLPNSQPRNIGDVEQQFENARSTEGEYWVPYLAHANMEPLNAVAWYHDNQLELWVGTQYPTDARLAAANILGIAEENVKVHTTYLGCGFGRRLETDFIEPAVYAAQALKGIPVKVMWPREEDMTHDVYRPMSKAAFRIQARKETPLSMDLEVSSLSLLSSYDIRQDQNKRQQDKFIVAGVSEQPYEFTNYRVTGYRAPDMLPAGWLRSVGESQNSFFHESVVDELAWLSEMDPLEMRLMVITHESSRAVLEEVARLSNWYGPLPAGHGRGLAYVLSSGAPTAQVIEVKSTDSGIKIVKAFAVVDVGIALDPRNIEAQVKSGLIFGLSAAISGEITVTAGKVDQTNFHQYAPLRIYQVPEIEISVIESGSEIFGVGESGTPAAAPALGNAIFAATGKRIRELPFENHISFIWGRST